MMKRQMLGLVAGLAIAAAGGGAQAADFTFNVPIDVRNMAAEISEGRVECFVSESTQSAPSGTGQQFFGLDSFGDFQGTLSVVVNVDAGADPGAATQYFCLLSLKDGSGEFQGVGNQFVSQFVVGTPTVQVDGGLAAQGDTK